MISDTNSRDPQRALGLYELMLTIRRFEEIVVELVNRDEIPGMTHESIGQEAVAVGVCSALRPTDVMTTTHRGHGHLIAKGVPIGAMMAELMGRATGTNRGRGGSMHVSDISQGIFGANGIVGAGVPIACGAAFAAEYRDEDTVAVAFFGDGAMNQGVVHESLNLAAIWDLPMVFVCENNGYAVTTAIESVSRMGLAERASIYGMRAVSIDGMDVWAVAEASTEAVDFARVHRRPSFIECRTYRYAGHQTAERMMKLSYRSEEELLSWKRRDPVANLEALLAGPDGLGSDAVAEVQAKVENRLAEAVSCARSSPWPEPNEVLDGMFSNPNHFALSGGPR